MPESEPSRAANPSWVASVTVPPEPAGPGSVAEAERLRSALQRRGDVEARLAGNRGQRALVRERDRAIEALVRSSVSGSARMLDLGCGYGTTLGHLTTSGAVAFGVGVDLLPERIEVARSRWPAVEFLVSDASQLPFDDGAFDAVLAMTVFSSVPLPGRAPMAAEIARVTRPGGVFIWYDMRVPSPSNASVRPFRAADAAQLFRGWSIRARHLTVLPPIARHLGPATDVLYPLFARIPILLSHEVGVARRPAL